MFELGGDKQVTPIGSGERDSAVDASEIIVCEEDDGGQDAFVVGGIGGILREQVVLQASQGCCYGLDVARKALLDAPL